MKPRSATRLVTEVAKWLQKRSVFGNAGVFQLPYLIPGAFPVVRTIDRMRRAPVPLASLDERLPPGETEEHKPCPLCGATEVHVRYRPTRYDTSGDIAWSYHVGQCPRCALLYRVPALKPDRVPELYEQGDYAEFLEGTYAKSRRRRYRATLDSFAPTFDDGADRRLLDLGCGTGIFMDLAAKRGFDVYGIDLAPDAVQRARQHFGEDRVFLQPLESLVGHHQFDVITMWSVLAHLPDPAHDLAVLRDLLQPDGVLLIMTVNADSLQRLTFRGRWNGFTPGHLIFWSRPTIEPLLRRAGFGAVEFAEFYGERIETGRSSLKPRRVARYRRVVTRSHGGNMLRVLARNGA